MTARLRFQTSETGWVRMLLTGWVGKTLQRRILLAVAMVGVILPFVLGYLSLQTARSALRDAVFHTNLQMAGLAAIDIQARYDAILREIQLLRDQVGEKGVSPGQQARAMFQRRAAAPLTYRAMYLFGPGGRPLLHLSGPLEKMLAGGGALSAMRAEDADVDPDVLAAVEKVQGGSEFYRSPVRISGPDMVPVSTFALLLPMESGACVLAVVVDLREIWKRVDAIDVGGTGRAYVVGETGMILAHPDRRYIGRRIPSAVSAVLEGYEGQQRYPDSLSGREMLASFTPAGKQSGWGVVVERDQLEAFEPVRRITDWTMFLMGVAVTAAVGISVLLSRGITRPVRRLVSATQHIAQTGDMDHSVEIRGPEEIADLADHFNQMIGSLRHTHEAFLTVLNSIDATIYVIDMHSHEILFMNRRLIDGTGGDFKGRTCYEVFRNAVRPCGDCAHERLLDASGNPKEAEVREEHNPHTRTWCINYDRAIKWVDGRIVHLQIATDITQLRDLQEKQLRAEARLRQSQKMESIGNLAGGIAHDFNNILSSILGYTELALEDTEKGSQLADNLQEVYTAGKRARDLVKQILAFARQSDEERTPVQVASIVEEALKLIQSTIPSTIEIRKNIASDSRIMGNSTQIHQLFLNLCTNAAQAMEADGGTMVIELADLQLDSSDPLVRSGLQPGSYIKLSVSDTGAGIDPGIIDTIFEPYFTTKRFGEGTGMGLALVHGIVKSYGGTIQVDSELRKGSTFSVYLPATLQWESSQPYEREEACCGREHILFVDDESAIAFMSRQLLERLGYRVTVYTSSVEALAHFETRPDDFDLVITDMTMPNLTGDQLAVELMKIRPDIPVILCTGYSRKMSDETAAAIGIRAFAYKPIVKKDLADTVRKVLDETKSFIR